MNMQDEFEIKVSVKDALKAVTVLGRSNGEGSQFYFNLLDCLGLNTFGDLGDGVHAHTSNALGVINYLMVQRDVENAYRSRCDKLLELKSKVAAMETLQTEINQLKSQLV